MTTNPEQTLQRIIGRAELLLAKMPNYRHAQALLAPSPLHATRTDRGPTSQGGHSDPTLNHVLATIGGPDNDTPHQTPHDDFLDALNAAAGTLDYALDNQRHTIATTQQRPRTDREQRHYDADMRANQCERHDPTTGERCPNQAARNGTCWTHIKRTQRAEAEGIVDMSTPERVEPRTSSVAPRSSPTLPSGATIAATTIWCRTCGDIPVPTDQDPHTWLNAHTLAHHEERPRTS